MAFSWTTITKNQTIIKDIHLNEVQTNLNTVISNLGISSYSWSRLPISKDNKIDDLDLKELRNAADYAYNNNICSAENTSKYTTVDSADYLSNLTSNDSSVQSTYNSSVDSGQDTTVYSGKYTSYDSSKYDTVLSSQNTSYDSSKYDTVLSSQNSSFDSTQNATVDTGQDASIYGTQNTSYCGSHYTSVYNPN